MVELSQAQQAQVAELKQKIVDLRSTLTRAEAARQTAIVEFRAGRKSQKSLRNIETNLDRMRDRVFAQINKIEKEKNDISIRAAGLSTERQKEAKFRPTEEIIAERTGFLTRRQKEDIARQEAEKQVGEKIKELKASERERLIKETTAKLEEKARQGKKRVLKKREPTTTEQIIAQFPAPEPSKAIQETVRLPPPEFKLPPPPPILDVQPADISQFQRLRELPVSELVKRGAIVLGELGVQLFEAPQAISETIGEQLRGKPGEERFVGEVRVAELVRRDVSRAGVTLKEEREFVTAPGAVLLPGVAEAAAKVGVGVAGTTRFLVEDVPRGTVAAGRFIASEEGREEIKEFAGLAITEPTKTLKGGLAVTGAIAVTIGKETVKETVKDPFKVAGEALVFGEVLRGAKVTAKGLKFKVQEFKFERGLRQFEESLPKLTQKELKARLETGGIETPAGDIQTTFDFNVGLIPEEVAKRAAIFEKQAVKGGPTRPEPPTRVAVIETAGKEKIVTLEQAGRFDTSKFDDFRRDIDSIRRRLELERVEVRDEGIQKVLVKPKEKPFDFGIFKEEKVKPPTKEPPFKPFEGEGVTPGISIAEIAEQQLLLKRREKFKLIEPELDFFPRKGFKPVEPTPIIRVTPKARISLLPLTKESFLGEFKPFVGVKPETRERLEERLKPSIDLGVKGLLVEDLERIKKQGREPITDVSPIFETIRVPDVIQEQKIELVPKLDLVQEMGLATELDITTGTGKAREELPSISVPPETGLGGIFFPFTGGRLREKRKQQFDAFDVTAREKGKDKKLNKVPLTKAAAQDLGSEVVDNTLSARFKVTKLKKKFSKPPKDKRTSHFLFNRFKFRDFTTNRQGRRTGTLPKGEFIEKRGRRLDSPGEVKEITIAKFLAQKKKDFVGESGMMQIKNRLL